MENSEAKSLLAFDLSKQGEDFKISFNFPEKALQAEKQPKKEVTAKVAKSDDSDTIYVIKQILDVSYTNKEAVQEIRKLLNHPYKR